MYATITVVKVIYTPFTIFLMVFIGRYIYNVRKHRKSFSNGGQGW